MESNREGIEVSFQKLFQTISLSAFYVSAFDLPLLLSFIVRIRGFSSPTASSSSSLFWSKTFGSERTKLDLIGLFSSSPFPPDDDSFLATARPVQNFFHPIALPPFQSWFYPSKNYFRWNQLFWSKNRNVVSRNVQKNRHKFVSAEIFRHKPTQIWFHEIFGLPVIKDAEMSWDPWAWKMFESDL